MILMSHQALKSKKVHCVDEVLFQPVLLIIISSIRQGAVTGNYCIEIS